MTETETIPESEVNSMCLTWRHDFGLNAPEPDKDGLMRWTDGASGGMRPEERAALRLQMRQLYLHHVLPAILAERERCAKVAERDVDWTAFQRRPRIDALTGDQTNVFAAPSEPDDTMPTDFNVFAYRFGIAAGRAIAAAIRSPAR